MKTENNKSNLFLESALKQIPRLLGQLNRNPSSRSYGSFDRAYWHYRTNAISCARYQEAVYTLALLYFSDFRGNIYHKDEKVLGWIRAGLRFTAQIQRANGSYDEWYLNEGSYVATSFVSAALAQTIGLFRKNNVELPEEGLILEVLEKSGRFLLKSEEDTVMNQVSGALFAIAASGKLLNNEWFISESNKLLHEFLNKQNEEGWWSEYGGPDIGYLSLTISYLCKYLELESSQEVEKAIAKARIFIEYFIHPDMTAGGEYMARNTEYLIPSPYLPYLGRIVPAVLDDRYLCYILYNWIEAGLAMPPQSVPSRSGEKYFEESKILRVSNSKYFMAANGMKGGSLRIYAEGKVYYDSGLEICASRSSCTSGILDTNNEVAFDNRELRVRGVFKPIKEPLLTTGISIIFKSWQLLFGKIGFLQKWIKKILRLKMISYSEGLNLKFKREIEYGENKVSITDTIYGEISENEVIFGIKSSYNAVPSSRYAPAPEIVVNQLSPKIEKKHAIGAYTIKRIFSF